ncbi:Glycosyl transferase family 2 [Salinihabitans flavidus]|uniref:Glycosyl transferase family 2 n=2 Tax=Salinihabitans flavidus TaxID=569882 RepID=A0A1H8QY13_9RHOB|nr:Glycosyl transferase family 2 [Salinihabitans flavidus]
MGTEQRGRAMRILAVTTVRDEGPYLLEWIAHHMGAGVTDFLIYSNDCSDGTAQMLDTLHDAGVICHQPQQRETGKSVQWQALNAAWKHPMRKTADWAWVADVDEFLNIHTSGHDIPALLAALPDGVDAVAVPWRLYGHNGVVEIADAPVTEQFTRAIPADAQFPIAATLFKSLVRLDGPFNQFGVHRPRQKRPEKNGLPRFVDGSGQWLSEAFSGQRGRLSLYGLGAGREMVECNHYAVRSAAGFLLKKARGLPNRAEKAVDLAYWVERNFNTVEDRSIAAMRPATEARLEALRAIPGLADLHETSVAWHRARFEEMVRTPEHQRLLVQILTAGGSTVPPEPVQRKLIAWYRAAHG